jgi:hypothetical protein
VNLVLTMAGDSVDLKHQPLPQMPDDLQNLFDNS